MEVVGPVNWWSSAADWASRDFVNRYFDRYGEAPISQSAAYYDAVYLIATALENSGENIQNGLENAETFTGVQGLYNTDNSEDGELTHSLLIIGFSDGQAIELARYDGETCLVGC